MTSCETLVETYLARVESDLRCTSLDSGERLLIDTPYLFPDGDVIQVVLEPLEGTSVRLGDEGSTLARLATYGVDVSRGSAARELKGSLRSYRADLVGDELRVEGSVEDTADMFLRLVGTMRAVDGLAALRTEPGPVQFATRLTTFLQSQFPDVKERPERIGTSGARYRLTASVPRLNDDVLVQSAGGGRLDVVRRSVEHAFRIFSDINGQVPKNRKLVVLSADAGKPWPPEEIKLLSRVAYVGGWEERERVVDFISGESIPDDPVLLAQQSSFS